ncbi:hypothetical protein [Alkalihalobacillus sp. AL-G]|nr:hypothetical protein [Alkalihalobacillus sp. AL-G]WLD95232.1 hypothetical protein MOJ78_10255 [Alkalihalobacillus sp. AL-G]
MKDKKGEAEYANKRINEYFGKRNDATVDIAPILNNVPPISRNKDKK